LINDAAVTSSLQRCELERIEIPTLAVSAADDLFGTYDGAPYCEARPTRSLHRLCERRPCMVGHKAELMSEIASFMEQHSRPAASFP
jgi:hypothetical protein